MSGLEFTVDWIGSASKHPEEAATACQLKITCDGEVLTRVEDLRSRSVHQWISVSAYPLALWFADNWWRLLGEPAKSENPRTDWRLAHELASAGHGYVWPKISMASDGGAVQITARESARADFETIRYIGNVYTQLPLASFEKSIAEFIELVLLRLAQFDLPDTDLHRLWSSVCQERADPRQEFVRRIEARLGYDPELAPEDAISTFERIAAEGGKGAAEEIAAIFSGDMRVELRVFETLATGPGIRATVPHARIERFGSVGGASPWEVGWSLAHWARETLGLLQPVLEDAKLSEVFAFSDAGVISQPHPAPPALLGLAVRARRDDSLRLTFRGWRRVSRRFELARFLCESLSAPDEDLWLPSTDAATARQKVQRAFAAEFLMPIQELKQVVGSEPTNEGIENAADLFGVSPLAVRSHLANNNLIARF